MPRYDHITTAVFRLGPGVDLADLLGTYYALSVPDGWPEIIRTFWQRKWDKPDFSKQLPLHRLNAVARAARPDVVDVATMLDPTDPKPWWYTRNPADSGWFKRLVQAWLWDMAGGDLDLPDLITAYDSLDIDTVSQDWNVVHADLDWIRSSNGHTAILDRRLYRLLPDLIAERAMATLAPFENQVRFFPVACRDGAELMSWPPLTHVETNSKTKETTQSRYSAVLRIQLRTVPFDPCPRIHITAHIRRWVSGKLFMPPSKAVTVYLRPDDRGPGTLPHGGGPRFATPALKWDHNLREVTWRDGGPAQILQRLDITTRFPDVATLLTDADTYLDTQQGIGAGVVYHTQMGRHDVDTGIMPDERRRLITWISDVLPELEPVRQLDLTRFNRLKPPGQLVSKKTKPHKKPKEPKAENYDAESETTYEQALEEYKNQLKAYEDELEQNSNIIDAHNAKKRRELLGVGMNGQELRVDILWQTNRILQALIDQASVWLGAGFDRSTDDPDEWVAKTDEVTVRITARKLGRLGDHLGEMGVTPKKGKDQAQAVDKRARDVAEFLASCRYQAELAFAEIPDEKTYRQIRIADPYRAIRIGAARADRVTQFITIGGKDKELPHRAAAAWADGIRQLGIRFVPPRSRDLKVPHRLDQVVFWLVRRNRTRDNRHQLYTPIALLIRPGQPRIMARTAETDGWISYPDLLKHLATSPPRDEDLRYEHQQREALSQLVNTTLYRLRNKPTLMLVSATNLRDRWRWFTDEALEPDRISIGDAPVQSLTAHGRHLRLIRVRDDGNRGEVPNWWAEAKGENAAGFTSGLFRDPHADGNGRVYYSLSEKNSKLNSHPMTTSKFTSYTHSGTFREPGAGKTAPVPNLLEVTVAGLAPSDSPDDAVDWAMYTHQQRFCAEYPEGLRLPYALAMAERTNEYALPHEEEDYEAPEEEILVAEQPTLF